MLSPIPIWLCAKLHIQIVIHHTYGLTDWALKSFKLSPSCWICKVTIKPIQSCKLFIIPTYFCSISQTNEFHSDVENLIISQILWNTQKSFILMNILVQISWVCQSTNFVPKEPSRVNVKWNKCLDLNYQ